MWHAIARTNHITACNINPVKMARVSSSLGFFFIRFILWRSILLFAFYFICFRQQTVSSNGRSSYLRVAILIDKDILIQCDIWRIKLSDRYQEAPKPAIIIRFRRSALARPTLACCLARSRPEIFHTCQEHI